VNSRRFYGGNYVELEEAKAAAERLREQIEKEKES